MMNQAVINMLDLGVEWKISRWMISEADRWFPIHERSVRLATLVFPLYSLCAFCASVFGGPILIGIFHRNVAQQEKQATEMVLRGETMGTAISLS